MRNGNTAAEGKNEARTGQKRRRRIRKIIVWLIVLVLAGGLGFLTVRKIQRDYRITYDAYTTTVGTISNSLSYTGTMQLINNTVYTAETAARIREIYVSEGSRVREGDKLMRLSDGTLLAAEFDGTVSKISVEKGAEVKKDDTLVQVADFDRMQVSFRIGESNINDVSAGQSIRVTVPSAGAVFTAEIRSIDYASYSGNNVAYYQAVTEVDTSQVQGIYPGMQATVTIPQEEVKDVVILKMDAVSTAADNSAFVWLQAEDGTMTQQPVTVGVSNGNYVEIREGLTEGQTVYAVAKTEEKDGGLFAGLFGSTAVNPPAGGMQNRNRNNGENSRNGSGSGFGR